MPPIRRCKGLQKKMNSKATGIVNFRVAYYIKPSSTIPHEPQHSPTCLVHSHAPPAADMPPIRRCKGLHKIMSSKSSSPMNVPGPLTRTASSRHASNSAMQRTAQDNELQIIQPNEISGGILYQTIEYHPPQATAQLKLPA
jgi:hypothetical protein